MSASVTLAQCFDRLADRGMVERTYGEGVLDEAINELRQADDG